jgi:serine/threonine protein phosphatase PrpC
MGPYLGQPNKEKESEVGENDSFRFGATSMQGWRKSQEDSHIAALDIAEDVHLFGVFDGHGGKEVSLYVKKVFVNELKKLESFKSGNYEQALREIFKKMDDLIQTPAGETELKKIKEAYGGDSMQGFGMGSDPSMPISQFTGCTATVVLISKDSIYCANAGDSRTVLARSSKTNQVEPLSEDHKPDNAEEKARIEAAGGFVEENRVNGSLNLSRSLGDFEYKSNPKKSYKEQMVTCDPEVKRVSRQPNHDEFIILACDGIWDCLTSEEAVTRVRKGLAERSAKEKINEVIENIFDDIIATDILSSSGVGTDNMTCVVVEFKKKY